MKSYKKIMPILLVIALLGSVAYSLNSRSETNNAYNTAVASARAYAENGIVVDAVEQYKAAIAIKPTLQLYLEAGQVYLDAQDYMDAKRWYKQIKKNYPGEAETYAYGIKLSLAQNNYRNAFEIYDDYKDRNLHSDEVEAAIDQIRYMYDLVGRFEDAAVFSEATHTAAALYDGMWGYVTRSAEKSLPFIFKEADVFSVYAAVVDREGNAYYIDKEGNVKINETVILNADPEFGKVVRFGNLQSGLLLAYNGKIWNYYQADPVEKKFGGFAKALPIANGIGAVSENGKDWALIGADGNLITDYRFSEVLSDLKSIVARADALVVREGKSYYLIDKTGNQIGSKTYDDACAFYDGSYAAVAEKGKWYFVDTSGERVFPQSYDGAQSFVNGLAAVRDGDRWGYIDTSGKLVIPCIFMDAKPFSSRGVAFVKVDEGTWRLLKLYQYNHG